MSKRYADDYDYFEPSQPIATDQGIKARSQSGKIGRSWWAGRWIAALELLMDAGRLQRGRSYARKGQVLSIEEKSNEVRARVQGSQPSPYRVTIRLKPLTAEEWEQVFDQMAAQAIFMAQLLAGEMPAEIEQAFKAAKVSLFPDKGGDLETACSCPDPANPCKHVAATHYILGEQFDEDPFMIFRLRGRSQEQILEALRARRAGNSSLDAGESNQEEPEEPEALAALEEAIGSFWQLVARPEGILTTVKPPVVGLPLLKRLGPTGFLQDQDLAQLLGPAYEAITRAALESAYGGAEGAGNAERAAPAQRDDEG
jgi:uncharacterized Zn finger protein